MFVFSRKALTEADASKILAQAFACKKPFGIPTITLLQELLPPREALPEICSDGDIPYGSDGKTLSDIYKETCDQLDDQNDTDYLETHLSQHHLIERIIRDSGPDIRLRSYACVVMMKGMDNWADHYASEQYIPPILNRILAPSQTYTAEDFCVHALFFIYTDKKDIAPLPGTPSQWGFANLIHEYGHGAGAGEAQTEMMMSIISRQVFRNTSFLLARADMRMIRAVCIDYENGNSKEDLENYGFPVVEAMDEVIILDQGTIDAMTEQDIIALRHRKFADSTLALKNVSKVFNDKTFCPHLTRSLFDCSERTRQIIDLDIFGKGSLENQIAARFTQAAMRFYLRDYPKPAAEALTL